MYRSRIRLVSKFAPIIARWMLLLAVAIAPLGGFVHALGHVTHGNASASSAITADDDDTAAVHPCELCLAYAATESSAPGLHIPASNVALVAGPNATVGSFVVDAAAPRGTARGPPSLLG